MSKRAESVLKEASQLPDDDRVQLIDDLLATLEGEPGRSSSDPRASRMRFHIQEILRLLRARGERGPSGSKRERLESLFGSLRDDPLERPLQGPFEHRDELEICS